MTAGEGGGAVGEGGAKFAGSRTVFFFECFSGFLRVTVFVVLLVCIVA